MNELTSEQIREKYIKLPQDLKDAVLGVDSTNIMKAIGEKHELTIDKIGEMVGEAGYVMLGFTHPNELIPNLARRLGIDKTKAREIAMDVNEQIFKKVRDSLRKIHNIRDEEEELEEEKKQETSNSPDSKDDILKEIEKDDVAIYAPPPVKTRSIDGGINGQAETGSGLEFEHKTAEIKVAQPIVPAPVASTLPETKDIAASAEGEKIPDIFKGVTNPFEAKLKNEMYVAPKEEIKREIEKEIPSAGNTYGESDPYREPIE